MATLIASANGNLTSASTWSVVDATSLIIQVAQNVSLTTTYANSATFTPGAIIIDGIAVQVALIINNTGTISVALDQAGSTVTGTEITLNISDLPQAPSGSFGWTLFKFASGVTLSAATAYSVKCKSSVANTIQLNSNNTPTTNWVRMLRTTTTQAPAAGDTLHIMNEYTGAGTSTARIVTNDQTSSTAYGSGNTSSSYPCVGVSAGGTLKFADTSAANPYLRANGCVTIFNSGTLTIGTAANTIPINSTAVLEFSPTADGNFGLISFGGSNVSFQGVARTTGKNVVACKLTANVAASA